MSRHVYDCWVRFSDVDVYGHVNNVKYFEYFQEARIAFFRELVGTTVEDPLPVVVGSMSVDYKRPILFRTDPYRVESWISRIGESSFDVSAEITDGETVLSRATASMVAFDLSTQRARALTHDERARMSRALDG